MNCKIVLLTFLLFYFGTAIAQNTDKGYIAFDKKDYKKAIKELKPFAEKGECSPQFAVGFSYWSAEGEFKNDSLARYWLEKAAEQKQAQAMGPLAVAYFGSSAPGAHIKAYMWAMLAAEYDPRQKFTTARVLIKKYLKPAEVEEGDKLIAAYMEKWKDKPNCQ